MSFKIKYRDFVGTYSKLYQMAIYYPVVLQKFKQGWGIEKISKSFGISYQTVWRWANEKSVPIPFVEYIKIKKEFNKEDIGNLALIMGNIFGDGGILDNGRVHYCNSEKFLVDHFVLFMNKVFDEGPYIKIEQGIIRIRYPARVGKVLWCLFGRFSFGKDTKIITHDIQKMPLKWKSKMLQTWFNDDGSVPNYGVIAIKQKLKPLILFIQDTLLELNIKSKIIKDNNTWLLRICGYWNLNKFKEKIGFSEGYRKTIRLNEVIGTINTPYFKTKNKILELLKKSPKTRKELEKTLGVKSGTIYGHLHGWKRSLNCSRKTNLGLIDLGFVYFKKEGKINIYMLDEEKSPGFGFSQSNDVGTGTC